MTAARKTGWIGTIAVVGLGYVALRFGLSFFVGPGAGSLTYEPVADPPGFRRVAAGEVSGAFDPFVGLGTARDGPPAEVVAAVRGTVCETLFDDGAGAAGVVPIASFSDYNCPFCRVLTQRLAGIEAAAQGAVAVTWHELPLLGEGSVAAARAALAAARQGAYVEFHARLMRSRFQATPDYLRVLAADLGIDADRLIADMDSADVTREIDESLALAQIFGFAGTPVMVIGTTVVQGEVGEAALDRLIEAERDAPLAAACP